MLSNLARYCEGLVCQPVAREEAGRAVAIVDRTNKVIEPSFAIAKQGLRRQLGRTHPGLDREDQPTQFSPLISNPFYWTLHIL